MLRAVQIKVQKNPLSTYFAFNFLQNIFLILKFNEFLSCIFWKIKMNMLKIGIFQTVSLPTAIILGLYPIKIIKKSLKLLPRIVYQQ